MSQATQASFQIQRTAEGLTVYFRGSWLLREHCPSLLRELEDSALPQGGVVRPEIADVTAWDSALPIALTQLADFAQQVGGRMDFTGLPADLRRLVALARAVPEKSADRTSACRICWLDAVGNATLRCWEGCREMLHFNGQVTLALLRLAKGRSALRLRDFLLLLQDVTTGALPIVMLISFLVGLIIAFLGAVVLRQFGAEFAVSYIVGYGMLREMGAVMTAIIMAGRTGSAYAAQISSMKVNEELDALRTFGISPIDLVVLPRVLALLLAMPLLTVFADFVGILGGFLVAVSLLGVGPAQFSDGMLQVVDVQDFMLGVLKGGVFGAVVGMAGCLRGMQSGSGAMAVGRAATSAVVTGITLIILCNALIDWLAALWGL